MREAFPAGTILWRCCLLSWPMRSRCEKLLGAWKVAEADWNNLGSRQPGVQRWDMPINTGRGSCSETFSTRYRGGAGGVRPENEVSISESSAKYRFQCGDAVLEDVSVGDMVAAKGCDQVAFNAGSRGLLTGGNGDYHGQVLRANGGTSAALCARHDFGDGSWICRLSVVPSAE